MLSIMAIQNIFWWDVPESHHAVLHEALKVSRCLNDPTRESCGNS